MSTQPSAPQLPAAFIAMAQVAVGLLLLAARCSAAGPNVIWIMADDLGWGEVGFLDAVQ